MEKIKISRLNKLLTSDENKVINTIKTPKGENKLDRWDRLAGLRSYKPSKKYADLLNGIIDLEDKVAHIEGSIVRIEYKQGVLTVNFSNYPECIKMLLLNIITPFEYLP